MKQLLEDLLEYMEQRADADIEGPNKEMGFQIRIEEALAKMDKADKVIQTCKSCGSFVFTADGTQCASCATSVEQPDLPAPNTVMWWLCRIADPEIRRKAVERCLAYKRAQHDQKRNIEEAIVFGWEWEIGEAVEWENLANPETNLLPEPDFTEYLEIRK